VLHDGFGFVGFYALRHHIHDVFHDGCAEFEVEVGLCALFCDGFYEAFGVAALELAGEQVAQPALQEGDDAAEEEQPDAVHGCPDSDARAFAHWSSVETVVDDVFVVLAHSDLAHQTVFVSVHTSKLAYVGIKVLQTISQLKSIHIPKPILHITIHHKFHHPQYLPAQVKRIAKPRLLPLLRRQSLHRLQIKIVIQMQIIEILPMYQQHQHIKSLP
jgi:hypothetical protein